MVGLVERVWDPVAAVQRCPILPWAGYVFRYHNSKYAGDDAAGSLRTSGRYNRGTDAYPVQAAFPALYTARSQHVALAERIRHTDRVGWHGLAVQCCTRLEVDLQRVLFACAVDDCLDLAVDGATTDDFCRDYDYSQPQAFAGEARRIVEAIMVPSCSRLRPGNLIIFPDCVGNESILRIIDVETPSLHR